MKTEGSFVMGWENVQIKLGENEWKILAKVFEKPSITIRELSDSINISTTAIEKYYQIAEQRFLNPEGFR